MWLTLPVRSFFSYRLPPISPEQEFGPRNATHGPVDQLVDFLLFPVAGQPDVAFLLPGIVGEVVQEVFHGPYSNGKMYKSGKETEDPVWMP